MSFTTPNVLGGGNESGYSALAAGTTTTTTYAATNYRIGAKTYTVGAGSNTATPTTDAVTGAAFVEQPVGSACAYVFGFNAAGTFLLAQGPIVTGYKYQNDIEPLYFPTLPDTFCPIGYEIVELASNASAWKIGTNNQATLTGNTKTFVPCAFLPSRPLA